MLQQIPKCFAFVGYGAGSHGSSVNSGHGIVQNVGKRTVVAVDGTFRKLVAYCNVARAVSITVTLVKNGIPTGLSVTLSAGDIQVSDTLHEVAVVPGDIITYSIADGIIVYPGVPMGVCVEFDADEQMYGIGAITGNPTIGHGWVGGAFGNGLWQTYVAGDPDSNSYSIAALDGAVTTLAIGAISGAPGSGIWRGMMRLNGVLQDGSGGTVDTIVELTGSDTSTVGTFSLPFSPPDHVDVVLLRDGTNAAFAVEHVAVGIGVTPTTPGQYMFCGGNNNTVPVPESWDWIGARSGVFSGNSIDMHTAPAGGTGFSPFAMYVERAISPGTGKTITHTLLNSGVDTPVVVTLTDAETSDNTIASTDFLAGDLITIDIEDDSDGPTGNYLHWGVGVEPLEEAPSGTGTITVTKVATDDPTQQFSFTAGGGLSPSSFTLKDGESITFSGLTPGSGYSLSETVPDGWTQSGLIVSDSSPVDNIDVSADETVTVTFTNALIDIPEGGSPVNEIVCLHGSFVPIIRLTGSAAPVEMCLHGSSEPTLFLTGSN